ncbi:MAG: hypothetical protein ACK2T3_14780 [Candidatus Promineifilaceae bacterium]|jgi:membrane protein YqaA with SNARE-associated domain
MNDLLNPVLWSAVIILTLLGVGFSFLKYEFGKQGWRAIEKKYPQIEEDRFDQALGWYKRRGSITLLLSAVPGLDTLVTIAAGAAGIGAIVFVIWVSIAKFVRFTLLALIFVGSINL